MEWRGRRSSRRRTRKQVLAPRFEWLEDRLAPAVAADADTALPAWLVHEQAEKPAEIWSEEAEQDQFLADQGGEAEPESPFILDDFPPPDDGVDALALTTFFPDSAVDQVFTTAEDASASEGTDPAEEFRKLAVLAPAVLEAVFRRPDSTALVSEHGSLTSARPIATSEAVSLPLTVHATTEAFKLGSVLHGVGGALDETGQGDWHTSRLEAATPMGSDPMAPESEPLPEPMTRPMSDARKSENAKTVLAAAPSETGGDKADAAVTAVVGAEFQQSAAVGTAAAPSYIPARGNFAAALLLWWLLLVAQFRVMRARRSGPCQVVRQRLRAVMRPPDPSTRREQRKADATVCLFCCAMNRLRKLPGGGYRLTARLHPAAYAAGSTDTCINHKCINHNLPRLPRVSPRCTSARRTLYGRLTQA